jgi:hypothetical protein
MIASAFIIDLLLLALTLFLGQMLADRLNAGNKTIAFQQSLFLNAFALIEFFKALLRLLFCPHVPALRPFSIRDERDILGAAPERAQRADWLRSAGCRADHLQPGERPVWRAGKRHYHALYYRLVAVPYLPQ